MALGKACSNLSTFDLVRKCQFCAFNESTDNSQADQIALTALHALCSDTCRKCTPLDTLLQFKTNEDLFRNEKCKVTFGFEYTTKTIANSCEMKNTMIVTLGTGKQPGNILVTSAATQP